MIYRREQAYKHEVTCKEQEEEEEEEEDGGGHEGVDFNGANLIDSSRLPCFLVMFCSLIICL